MFLCIGLAAALLFVLIPTNDMDLVDEFPSTAAYVIKTDGTNYWAVHANGTICWTSTNASDVFNNAISTLTSGGKIFAKSGTYTLSNSIVNGGTINNVVFEGEGDTTQFIVNANTNVTAISIANATGWKFRNFYLDGNHANNVQHGGTGPLVGYGEIQQDMYQNGIHFWYVSNSEISQVTVNNTVQHAINLHAYCGNNIISQCRIENGGMTGAYVNNAGILVWDHSNNNTVTNNVIISPYCIGIYTSVTSSFNTFTGNQIIPNQGNLRGKGILVVTGCTNDIIANNNIQVGGTGATDYIPIFIDGISSGGVTTLIQVSGNTINYPYTTAPAPKGMGIRFDNVNYSIIANNIISNTGMSAILLLNSSCYNSITGNNIWNSSQLGVGVQRNGTIELESGSSFNVFTGNVGYGPAANFGYYELDNTCDYNTVISCSFKNYNFGIRPMGANTKVNLCWNGTAWIT